MSKFMAWLCGWALVTTQITAEVRSFRMLAHRCGDSWVFGYGEDWFPLLVDGSIRTDDGELVAFWYPANRKAEVEIPRASFRAAFAGAGGGARD